MTTVNACGNNLSGTTGSGNYVGSEAPDISDAVLTTPASLGVQQQPLDMNNHLINAVSTPISPTDAANKNYVDNFMTGNFLLRTNNLSDVSNVATSRFNLGLGTAAVENTSSATGTVSAVNGSTVVGNLPEFTDTMGTIGDSGVVATSFLVKANNLSDVTSVSTSRTNLGLGTAAVQNSSSNTGIVSAVSGSVTIGHIPQFSDTMGTIIDSGSTTGNFLVKTNNLSDVSSASTSRTNLGLGTAATANASSATGTVSAVSGTTTSGDFASFNNTTGTITDSGFSSSSFLLKSNNLSDLPSASTARTNLGLGSVATKTASNASLTNAVMQNGTPVIGNIPQYNDTNGTIIDSGTAVSAFLLKANNLSDLSSASTARTNLGLGTAATANASSATGTVAAVSGSTVNGNLAAFNNTTGTIDDSGFAASQFLVKTNNLSDLTNASTARTNLGLGTAATANASSATGTVSAVSGATVSGNIPQFNNTTGTIIDSGFAITGSIRTIKIQVFTSTGTYTPSTGMLYCVAETVGAGGGGGGAATSGVVNASIGGAGGGGGYAKKVFSSATIGASQTVTIGAAGTAGAAGTNNGGTGGTTSLGALLSATGGAGGLGGAANTGQGYQGALGGVGSSGSFNTNGNPGASGISTSTMVMGGAGGLSFFGGAARGLVVAGTGNTALSYGGGGSGGVTAASAQNAGGAGFQGIVIITEFCNQ